MISKKGNVDYGYITRLTKKYLKSEEHYITEDALPFVIELCKIISKILPAYYGENEFKCNTRLEITESINILFEFLKANFPELEYNIRNIFTFDRENIEFISIDAKKDRFYRVLKLLKEKLDNGEMTQDRYEKIKRFQESSFNSNDFDSFVSYDTGKVTIHYENTINDAFTILHEMMHKVFLQTGEDTPESFNYLCETTTILIEFLLADYLIENKISESDSINYLKWRMSCTLEATYKMIFENMLMKIYKEYKRIDENKVDREIDLIEDIEIKEIFRQNKEEYLKDVIRTDFCIPASYRYVLGTLFACLIKQRTESNKDTLASIINIGKETYNDDFIDALKKLKLDFCDREESKRGFLRVVRMLGNKERINELIDAFINSVHKIESSSQKLSDPSLKIQ